MADVSGGANRIELESQILCSALRLSWADDDGEGVFRSCRELYHLFPDLLPPPKVDAGPSENLYDLLNVRCDVPQAIVIAGYFRSAKQFLRQYDPKENREDYYRILNAGFVLRKPRLRLSHDLVVGRQWLIDQSLIPEDGTL